MAPLDHHTVTPRSFGLADGMERAACRSGDGYDDEKALKELNSHLGTLEGEGGSSNRIFYLALPPHLFALSVRALRQHCWSPHGMQPCMCFFIESMSNGFACLRLHAPSLFP